MSAYEELFRALNQAGVRYVVVGGLAVVLQGYARDIEQLERILEARGGD